MTQGDIASNEILVDLDLYRQDALALQTAAEFGLATTVSNAFIAITALRDIFGNSQQAVQVVQASTVVADTTPLHLQAFDWEQHPLGTTVLVSLYFSKVVDAASFRCSDLALRSAPNRNAADIVNPQDTDCTLVTGQVDSHVIQFTIPTSLFASTIIGQSTSTTWINVPVTGATVDLSGNAVVNIRSESSLRVGPQLLRFHFNVNLGLVIYDFSKSINFKTPFNVSQLGFYSGFTGMGQYLQSATVPQTDEELLQLAQFPPTGGNSTIGALYLSGADLTAVKLLDIRASRFYALIADNSTLFDYLGRNVAPKTPIEGLIVSDIAQDDQAPYITHLALDLSEEVITIVVRKLFFPYASHVVILIINFCRFVL